VDVVFSQTAAAFEDRQFDDEGTAHDLTSQPFDKLASGLAGASGGQ
jgi:hypothetical protein